MLFEIFITILRIICHILWLLRPGGQNFMILDYIHSIRAFPNNQLSMNEYKASILQKIIHKCTNKQNYVISINFMLRF